MNILTKIVMALALSSALTQAASVTLTLSQEQDGGEAGRACMYIHQGKAEYRRVNPQESCPPTVTLDDPANQT